MTGSSWVASAAALVLDVTVGATLLLGLAALLTVTMLRRSPAAARHLAWVCTLGALLVLPLVALAVPEWRLEVRAPGRSAMVPASEPLPAPEAASPVAAAPPVTVTPVSSARSRAGSALPAAGASLPSPLPAPPVAPSPRAPAPGPSGLPVVALGVWGAGMLLVLARFGLRLRTLNRFAARCVPYPDEAAFELLDEAAARLDTSPGIHLLQAPADQLPTGPMTWGIHEPVVVLPPGALLWPPARMRSVLLHEVAHVQRRDWAGYLFANVVCAVYWFHPLVWWAAARMRAESELACDDQVLRAGIPATEYAHALVEIIKSLRGPVGGLKVAISMAQGPQIEQRLRAILDPHRRRGHLTSSALAIAVTLSAAAAVPAGGLRLRPAAEPGWTGPDTRPEGEGDSAAAPRDARVAWGQPAGGLRAGLEWASWDEAVRPGEVLTLRVRLRNTGAKAVRLSCLNPSGWTARLDKTSRITLSPVVRGGGAVHTTALWLPAGKECFVPGPGPQIRIDPEALHTASAAGEVLSVPAGRYQIVAARPLMVQQGAGAAGSLFTGLLPLQVLGAAGSERLSPGVTPPAHRISRMAETGTKLASGAKPARSAAAPGTPAREARPAVPASPEAKARRLDLRARMLQLQQRVAEAEDQLAELKAAQATSASSVLIKRLEERIATTEEQIVVAESQSGPETAQLTELKQLRKALEQRLAQARGELRVRGDQTREERLKLQDRLVALKVQLAEVEEQLGEASKPASRAAIPRSLPHPVEDPTDAAHRDRMIQLSHGLAEAEAELAELRTQYGDQHPKIKSVRNRIAALRQQQLAAAQPARHPNAAALLNSEIATTEARLQQLRARHQGHSPQVRLLEEQLAQLRQQFAAVESARLSPSEPNPAGQEEAALSRSLEQLQRQILTQEQRYREAHNRKAPANELNTLRAAIVATQKRHSDLSARLLHLIQARLTRARQGK